MLKFNANQRYATTAITAAMLREVASRGGVPMQEVIVRNDSHCGSTIGPMLLAKLGLRTVGECILFSMVVRVIQLPCAALDDDSVHVSL